MKRYVAIAAVCVAGFLFAACSAGSTGPAKVSFWHIDVQHKDFWQGLANKYTAAHPNVTITITVLDNEAFKAKAATVMQSGNPPDLFQSWGGGVMAEYASAGLLRDITKWVKGTDWGKTMAPGVIAVYSYKGKQYGMPYDMGAVTFWYNKDMLAKAGYTSFPNTWDDFVAMLTKLKSTGVTPVALSEGDKWPGMFWWAYLAMRIGGEPAFDNILSGQGKFTDPPFIQAGQKLVQLSGLKVFEDGFLGAKQADGAALVGNAKAAMELMGQWGPSVEASSAVNKVGIGASLDTAPFPTVAGGAGAGTDVLGGGNGFAVGKNAPDAAVDFLKFVTSVDNNSTLAATGSIVPTAIGADAAITDPLMKAVKGIVDKAGYFQLYLDQFYTPAVGGAINDAVQQIFAGTQTPDQAAAAIQAAYDANK